MLIFFFSTIESQNPTLKAKYQKLKDTLELTSTTIDFVLLKVLLVFTLMPAAFLTIINYIINDLNDAAYVLPFPVM